jgi:hypothetical protein
MQNSYDLVRAAQAWLGRPGSAGGFGSSRSRFNHRASTSSTFAALMVFDIMAAIAMSTALAGIGSVANRFSFQYGNHSSRNSGMLHGANLNYPRLNNGYGNYPSMGRLSLPNASGAVFPGRRFPTARYMAAGGNPYSGGLHGMYSRRGRGNGAQNKNGHLFGMNAFYAVKPFMWNSAILGLISMPSGAEEYLQHQFGGMSSSVGFPSGYSSTGATGASEASAKRTGGWNPKGATPLAKGGIVAHSASGINAIIGEGGRDERVTTLDRYGRGELEVQMLETLYTMDNADWDVHVVNHVHESQKVDVKSVAETISREVMMDRRVRW